LNQTEFRPTPLIATVVLAAFLWFVTFYLTWATFWIKISFSATILALLAFRLQSNRTEHLKFNGEAILLGLVSAAALYLVFWIGNTIATLMMSFAGQQIKGVYDKGAGTPMWIIALLLFFITGPAEEFYWRGYLQKNLMLRFGQWQGWLLATAIYAGVHIWSFNFMLIAAAFVAGSFWGAMYWRFKNLAPVIISHSIWSTVIFAVLPIN